MNYTNNDNDNDNNNFNNSNNEEYNNYNWTKQKAKDSLKLREIWQDQLKHENNIIHNLLKDAWTPYSYFIEKEFSTAKNGYDLISDTSLIDKCNINLNLNKRIMIPTVELRFFWIPTIYEDDTQNEDFKILPVKFNKKQMLYVQKILNKFSQEIELPVLIAED